MGFGRRKDSPNYSKLELDDNEASSVFINESLVSQILQLLDEEIISIFDGVFKEKPHLRKEVGRTPRTRKGEKNTKLSKRELQRFFGDQPIDIDSTPRPNELSLRPKSGEEPVVQFACNHYFVSESEDVVTIQLMRLGNLSCQSHVHYKTKDITAKAGFHFEEADGILAFSVGESFKVLKISVLQNEEWDTTLTFQVDLVQDRTDGAIVGRSLWQTLVHVINDDAFPTNKYATDIRENGGEGVPPVGLLMEYMKLQWSMPLIRSGTKKILLLGLFHNMTFLLKLFMNLYLLKSVLVPAKGSAQLKEKHMHLIMIAATIVIPFAIAHFMEYYKFNWKVGGMSRALLQKALLRKFLSCDPAARTELKDGILIMGVARDCQDLVAHGYMGAVTVVNTATHLLFLMAFQFLAPAIFKLPPRPSAFVPMIVFPVVLVILMSLRNRKSVELLFDRNNQQVDIVDGIVETVKDYRLIADYDATGDTVERFEKEIKEFNLSDIACLQLLVNNAHLTPWITTIFVAGYTYMGGLNVIRGDLTLPMYLTNIAVFTQMGAAYSLLLNMCVQVQTAFPALLRITKLLNLSSDDNTRMTTTRFQCDKTQELARKIQPGIDSEKVAVDLMPLIIKDVRFQHFHAIVRTGRAHPNDISPTIFIQGNCELQQGRLISFVGPHSGGKSTVLRALGAALIQEHDFVTGGHVFVPCHLRVIHIPSENIFVRGSLYANLCYGVRKGDSDGEKSRVKQILRMLGLPGNVMNLMEEASIHAECWLDVLCESQRQLLGLARALIANPQVICIHKPTDKYSEAQGKIVLSVLKTFVQERGLAQVHKENEKRSRPRTCLMTNVNIFAKDFADDFIFIAQDGMRRIDKSEVTEEMLRK